MKFHIVVQVVLEKEIRSYKDHKGHPKVVYLNCFYGFSFYLEGPILNQEFSHCCIFYST